MSTDEAFNRGGALRLQNEFDRLFMFACTHFPQSAMNYPLYPITTIS